MRTPAPHPVRCRAMSKIGQRCPFPIVRDSLCGKHLEHGAVIPDDWTQPDNFPVFYYAARLVEAEKGRAA